MTLEKEKKAIDDIIREIADISTFSYNALSSLPLAARESVCYQYMLNNGVTPEIYDVMRSACAVSSLSNISDLISVSMDILLNVSFEAQEYMCGMYNMEYSAADDNTEIKEKLKVYLKSQNQSKGG